MSNQATLFNLKKKSKLRRTEKLKGAVEILAGGRFADCHPEEIMAAVELSIFTTDSIYRDVKRLGYKWLSYKTQEKRVGRWIPNWPEWVLRFNRSPRFAEARRMGQGELNNE